MRGIRRSSNKLNYIWLFYIAFILTVFLTSRITNAADGYPVTEGATADTIDVITIDMQGDSHLNGVDNIDATTEATFENALDLQNLQGTVTDSQVPDNITITESDPYATLLAGRSGGQILKGGTGNGESLSFWTNATGVVGNYYFTDLFTNGIITTNDSTGRLSIITDNSSNWDIAYGWGDHSSQNYFDKDSDTLFTLLGLTDPDADRYVMWDDDLGEWVWTDVDAVGDVDSSDFTADGDFLVGTGVGTYQAESGSIVRTSLGLGTGDTPQFRSLVLASTAATQLTINRVDANHEGEIIFKTGANNRWSFGAISDGTEAFRVRDVYNGINSLVITAGSNLITTAAGITVGLTGVAELTAGSINRTSGTLTLEIGGTAEQSITSTETTFGGNLIIPDSGYIGSVSDTDAIQIEADGDVVLSQKLGTGGSIYVNETTNTFMTTGLTINQGAASNEILALKSTTVNHPFTSYAEADTFGNILKASSTAGGVYLKGFTDTNYPPLVLSGWIGSTTPTQPAIQLLGYKSDGSTGLAVIGSTEKLLAINNGGGDRWYITGGGDVWATGDVSAQSFTDRTPFYEGDALLEIANIKGKDGKIDHSTLPEFAHKTAEVDITEEVELTEVDISDVFEMKEVEEIIIIEKIDKEGKVAREKKIKNIKTEITGYEIKDGEVVEKIKQIPEYETKLVSKKSLKENIYFDEKTGKMYQKVGEGSVFERDGKIIQSVVTGKKTEDRRDLGAMISIHDVAFQQLIEIINKQDKRIDELEKMIINLN